MTIRPGEPSLQKHAQRELEKNHGIPTSSLDVVGASDTAPESQNREKQVQEYLQWFQTTPTFLRDVRKILQATPHDLMVMKEQYINKIYAHTSYTKHFTGLITIINALEEQPNIRFFLKKKLAIYEQSLLKQEELKKELSNKSSDSTSTNTNIVVPEKKEKTPEVPSQFVQKFKEFSEGLEALQKPDYYDDELKMTHAKVLTVVDEGAGDSTALYTLERFQWNRYIKLNTKIKELDAFMTSKKDDPMYAQIYPDYVTIRDSAMKLNMAWRKDGMSGGEKALAAMKGIGIGAYETVKGVLNLTIFLASLPFSPEKRAFVGKIWDTISTACSTNEERTKAWNLFTETITKFYIDTLSVNSTMQPDEQSELAGKIIGSVLTGVGIARGGIALGTKVLEKGGKVAQANRILQKPGLSEKRIQYVEHLRREVLLGKYGAKSAEIILGGIAESAIGMTLKMSILKIKNLFSSPASFSEIQGAIQMSIDQAKKDLTSHAIAENVRQDTQVAMNDLERLKNILGESQQNQQSSRIIQSKQDVLESFGIQELHDFRKTKDAYIQAFAQKFDNTDEVTKNFMLLYKFRVSPKDIESLSQQSVDALARLIRNPHSTSEEIEGFLKSHKLIRPQYGDIENIPNPYKDYEVALFGKEVYNPSITECLDMMKNELGITLKMLQDLNRQQKEELITLITSPKLTQVEIRKFFAKHGISINNAVGEDSMKYLVSVLQSKTSPLPDALNYTFAALRAMKQLGIDMSQFPKDDIEALARIIMKNTTFEEKKILEFIQSELAKGFHNITEETRGVLFQRIRARATLSENPNIEGALKLGTLTTKDLSEFHHVPRIIEVDSGQYISIVLAGKNKGIATYTIRYGITKPNEAYPGFNGISLITVENGQIRSYTNPYTYTQGQQYEGHLQKLLDTLNPKNSGTEGFKAFPSDVSKGHLDLPELPMGTIAKSTQKMLPGIPNAKIYDAGVNSSGQSVYIVDIMRTEESGGGRFEINLFVDKDGTPRIYIGAMAKDGNESFIEKNINGILPRFLDILSKLPNPQKKMPVITYFRAKHGKIFQAVEEPLVDTINSKLKGNDTLRRMLTAMLERYYRQ